MLVSAHEKFGIDSLWETILEFKAAAESGGGMHSGRRAQRLSWLWAAVGDMVTDSLQRNVDHEVSPVRTQSASCLCCTGLL